MASGDRGPALEFRDVHITYRGRDGDVPAVRGVDLAVAAGSSLGIAGESGSGKSTLISTVLRLQPKSATVTGDLSSLARGPSRTSSSCTVLQTRHAWMTAFSATWRSFSYNILTS